MSLKLKFGGSSDSGLLLRSRSFTGGHRRLSSAQSSLRSKPVAGKPRIPSWSRSVWGQQPEQVDRIFQALKRGLNDYLEHHQTELDFLSSQQTQTKRSSRLGFIYDLEKEIRTVERLIRRLEFQISKVEELYESYCVQWRLCQGAVNMRKAFSLSPSSPESRQSLLELNRNYRHSQEDMCTMEGELEILLGELQIRMKGLIGFARLCPGDQYEVLIRLGRQRWRVRGQIQTDDSQMWDEEEMVFLPQIHGNFEIKVMEVRGLISVLVGMVSCRSADFFTARPQMMVVDITELGTIKLQLEVVWKPFDSSDVKPPSHSVSSRKGSVYNWTPPNSPSFTEKYFLSMMRQLQDADESFSIGSRKTRGVSLLSYLSDSTQGLGPPAYEKSSLPPLTPLTLLQEDHLLQTPPDAEESLEWLSQSDTASPSPAGSKRDPIFLFQRFSTPDILKQETTFIQQQEPRVAQTLASLLKDTDEALQELSAVETELKELNLQINKLRVLLKRNIGPQEAPSSQALAVEEEEVLGRFDFLSVDCNEDETSGADSVRKRGVRLVHQKLEPPDDERQAVSLSTGLCSLDQALETHLSICTALVAALKHCESALVHDDITDELSRQIGVLKTIISLMQKRMDEVSVATVLAGAPQGVEGLWRDCCSSDSQFCCSVEDFLKSLRKHFIHKVKAKHPGQADAVFNQLLHQMQCSGVMACVACVSSYSTERVTVFQLCVYLQRWSISDFGQHVSLFSKEVYLIACLETPKRRQALQKLKGKRISDLQPTGCILQLLARLQMDTNHKVASAAMSCLKRASRSRYFRPKAVVHYTDLLRTGDTQVQREACLALKCLKASESAEQVAELWRSVDEDLRNIARETVLSFGKAGHSAFQRIDQIYEMDDDVYKNLETETTVF